MQFGSELVRTLEDRDYMPYICSDSDVLGISVPVKSASINKFNQEWYNLTGVWYKISY